MVTGSLITVTGSRFLDLNSWIAVPRSWFLGPGSCVTVVLYLEGYRARHLQNPTLNNKYQRMSRLRRD